MAIKTSGTQIYFIHPVSAEVINLGCVTSIDNVGAPLQSRDVTPVESEWEDTEPGMFSLGQIDFTILFDLNTSGHLDLLEIYESRLTINFAIGLSDGGSDPLVDLESGEFIGVDDRSFLTFRGWVMDMPFSFPINEMLPVVVSVMQSPSRIDGVYGVGLLPKGPESSVFVTSAPYPIEFSDSMGSEFSGVRVQPSYVFSEFIGSSFLSISGSLRDVLRFYDHPVPECIDSVFLSINGSLRDILRFYDHPVPECVDSAFYGIQGDLNQIRVSYDDYGVEKISSSFHSILGDLV